jgi:hypothetical protein
VDKDGKLELSDFDFLDLGLGEGAGREAIKAGARKLLGVDDAPPPPAPTIIVQDSAEPTAGLGPWMIGAALLLGLAVAVRK